MNDRSNAYGLNGSRYSTALLLLVLVPLNVLAQPPKMTADQPAAGLDSAIESYAEQQRRQDEKAKPAMPGARRSTYARSVPFGCANRRHLAVRLPSKYNASFAIRVIARTESVAPAMLSMRLSSLSPFSNRASRNCRVKNFSRTSQPWLSR